MQQPCCTDPGLTRIVQKGGRRGSMELVRGGRSTPLVGARRPWSSLMTKRTDGPSGYRPSHPSLDRPAQCRTQLVTFLATGPVRDEAVSLRERSGSDETETQERHGPRAFIAQQLCRSARRSDFRGRGAQCSAVAVPMATIDARPVVAA